MLAASPGLHKRAWKYRNVWQALAAGLIPRTSQNTKQPSQVSLTPTHPLSDPWAPTAEWQPQSPHPAVTFYAKGKHIQSCEYTPKCTHPAPCFPAWRQAALIHPAVPSGLLVPAWGSALIPWGWARSTLSCSSFAKTILVLRRFIFYLKHTTVPVAVKSFCLRLCPFILLSLCHQLCRWQLHGCFNKFIWSSAPFLRHSPWRETSSWNKVGMLARCVFWYSFPSAYFY